jgi:hypothetical protein
MSKVAIFRAISRVNFEVKKSESKNIFFCRGSWCFMKAILFVYVCVISLWVQPQQAQKDPSLAEVFAFIDTYPRLL